MREMNRAIIRLCAEILKLRADRMAETRRFQFEDLANVLEHVFGAVEQSVAMIADDRADALEIDCKPHALAGSAR
jgi:predicted component of type VI protein secretion system